MDETYEQVKAEVEAIYARLRELGLIEVVPGDEDKPSDEQRWRRTERGELDSMARKYARSVN